MSTENSLKHELSQEKKNTLLAESFGITVDNNTPDFFKDMNALFVLWEMLNEDEKTIFAGFVRLLHKEMNVRIFASFKQYGAECIGLTRKLWK